MKLFNSSLFGLFVMATWFLPAVHSNSIPAIGSRSEVKPLNLSSEKKFVYVRGTKSGEQIAKKITESSNSNDQDPYITLAKDFQENTDVHDLVSDLNRLKSALSNADTSKPGLLSAAAKTHFAHFLEKGMGNAKKN